MVWVGMTWFGLVCFGIDLFGFENYYSGRPAGRPAGRRRRRRVGEMGIKTKHSPVWLELGLGLSLATTLLLNSHCFHSITFPC